MSEVPITTEWALWGKRSNDRGYRLLQCSDGPVGSGAFTEAITRYSPGTLERLPQVTVNWLRLEGRRYYVAMAVHDTGDDQHDAAGRKIVFTRYFCAPYDQLAVGAVSYQAMYAAFVKEQPWLRDGDPSPLYITLPEFSGVPASQANALAIRVAALLLTGRAVCVLHADLLDLDERLRFLDEVMALLPYGMRSEMSASTWASSTATEHKLRLFFASSARRSGDDHVVNWDQPGNGRVGHNYADDYLHWLADCKQSPAAKLAAMNKPVGFKQREILAMLEQLHVSYDTPPQPLAIEPPRPETQFVRLSDTGPMSQFRPASQTDAGSVASSPADTIELSGPAALPGGSSAADPELLPAVYSDPHAAPDRDLSIEEILGRFGRRLDEGEPVILRPDMHRLSDILLKQPVQAEDRQRYQQLVKQTGLLRTGRPIEEDLRPEFYRLLLRLAFDSPVTYQDYLVIEECAEHQPPRSLLDALAEGQPADLRVLLLINHALGERTLRKKLRELKVAPSVLMSAASHEDLTGEHARALWRLVIPDLEDRADQLDKLEIQEALANAGFLARTLDRLYPHQREYQRGQLKCLLRLAYGDKLDRRTAREVLESPGHMPTPALLAAVLRMVNRDDAGAAERSYCRGLLGNAGFDQRVRDELLYLLPGPRTTVPPPPASQYQRVADVVTTPDKPASDAEKTAGPGHRRADRRRLTEPGSNWLLFALLVVVAVVIGAIVMFAVINVTGG